MDADSRAVSQTITDTLNITTIGPVSICRFDWADKTAPRVGAKVVSTAALRRVLRRAERSGQPVTAAAELRYHCVLTEEGLRQLHAKGPSLLYGPSEERVGVLMAENVDRIVSELEPLDKAAIVERVIEVDPTSEQVWGLDANDDDGPLRLPVRFEISSRYVDIELAKPVLEAHPDVLDVSPHGGRPWSFANVPAALYVTARFDDATWKVLCDATITRYGRYRRSGERPPGPTGVLVSQVLLWQLSDPESRTPDPFGLRPFARSWHEGPSEE